MNRVSSFLLVQIIVMSLCAQKVITISGKVVDVDTKKPLAFATISIQHTTQGVVTNEEGAFDLIAPKEASITISTLGYTPRSFSVEAILSNNQVLFELRNEPILLEEVVIEGERKELTADAILKLALKNQKKNYPTDNYSLSVFFRETNQINEEYIKLVEAAATIHGKKYPNTSKKIFIDEIRTASDVNVPVPLVTETVAYNPFREFQGLVGKSNIKACKGCPFAVENYTTFEGRPAAIVASISPNKDYPRSFRYFIDLETYAVVRMEFESKIPFGAGFSSTHENYESSLVYLKRTFDYKSYEGKYYLSRYHQESTHQYEATNDSFQDYQTTHNFHVVTNNIESGSVPPDNDTDLMKYRNQISESSKSYNADFWKSYNILKQTPTDEKIISDLSKGKSLDHLFNKGN